MDGIELWFVNARRVPDVFPVWLQWQSRQEAGCMDEFVAGTVILITDVLTDRVENQLAS